MRNFTKQLLPLSISVLMLFPAATSCDKAFLDPDMDSYIKKEESITDISSLRSAVNGCYDGLQAKGYYGRNFVAIGDVCSDNCFITVENNDLFTDLYNLTPTSSDRHLKAFWLSAYQVINRCNRAIEAAETLGVEDEEVKSLRAEAIFIRSLAHFDLVRVFAPAWSDANKDKPAIPYVAQTSDEIISPLQQSLFEIYSLLSEELMLIENHFSSTSSSSSFKASKNAVNALLARIYFYQGKYGKAYSEAFKLVRSGEFEFINSADYHTAFTSESNSEAIFSIHFSNSDFNGTSSLGYLYAKAGNAAFTATSDLTATFNGTDIRSKLFAQQDGTYSTKFSGKDGQLGTDNIPVLRFSELVYIMAESLVRLGYDENAIELIEPLMFVRDPNIRPINEMGLSSAQFLELIIEERQKEFAFEGHRFFDLKRLQRGFERSDCQSTCSYSYSDDFAFPIPESEVNANVNID